MQNIQKIGLLELAHHNEVLRSYIILLLSLESIDLYIFTNNWNHNQFFPEEWSNKLNWIIQGDEETSQQFIHSKKSLMNSMDLIIQTTAEDIHNKIVIPKINPKKAIVIHDLHTHFSPLNNIYISKDFPLVLKELMRLCRFFLFTKRRLNKSMKSADFLILPSANVLKYAIKNYGSNNNFVNLPFTINDEISTETENDPVRITIPGTISSKSRDYEFVVEALRNLPRNIEINLTLLGRPDGEYGIKVIESLKNIEQIELHYFTSFVPQKEFDKVIRRTDFLILPMQKIMKFNVIGERNGYSCVSGNINDMVRYGIPTMLPSYYPLPEGLKEMTYQYTSSKDLNKGITEWIESKEYNIIKADRTKEALELFSKENIAKLFVHNFTPKKVRKL